MSIFKRIRLPFFNGDNGGSGGGEPAPATPAAPPVTPATAPPVAVPVVSSPPPAPKPENPLRTGKLTEPIVAPPVQPAAAAPEPTPAPPEEIDFGGRKLKLTDPALKDLHRDWSELTGTVTRESQRAKSLENELIALRQTIATTQPQQQPSPTTPPEPQQPAAPTPEKIKEINDKYQEMVYEDPLGAMVWLQQQPEYQQMVRPLQEKQVQSVVTETQEKVARHQQQVRTQADLLAAKHTDFRDMLPAMDRVVAQYPHMAQQMQTNPTAELMESIYFIAKGLSAVSGTASSQPPIPPAEPVAPPVVPPTPAIPQAPAQPPAQPVSVDQLMTNPELLKQIVGSEQIQKLIISNYLAGVNQSHTQVPVVMGAQPGGQPPAVPDVQPQTIKEGGKMFRSMLAKIRQ